MSPNQSTWPLRRLNLNLLYSLDALLHTQTVTEAAGLIGLSQPAMSLSLAKLRDHFGDDLIVHSPAGARQTALASFLRPRVRRLLLDADDVFRLNPDFDPATAAATFRIAVTEPIELMYLSKVIPRLLLAAPGLVFHLVPIGNSSVVTLLDNRVADVALTLKRMADPQLSQRPLFSDSVSCMVWAEHPTLGNRISAEEYAIARHAALLPPEDVADMPNTPVQAMLDARNVVVRTRRHSTLPNLVIGTDLVATTSSWLAQHHASLLPVRVLAAPFEAAGASEVIVQWLPHRRNEPLVIWIIEQLGMACP